MKKIKVYRANSSILDYKEIDILKNIYKKAYDGKLVKAKRLMTEYLNLDNILEDFAELKNPSKLDLDVMERVFTICKIFDANGQTLISDTPYDNAIVNYKLFRKEPIVERLLVSRRTHDTVHDYPELKGTLDKSNKFYKKDVEKSTDVPLEPFIRKCFECVPKNTKLKFILSKKVDGNSGVITIKKTNIKKLLTRGEDGKGIDISHIFKHIKYPNCGANVGLKVEIAMTKENFDKYSVARGKKFASLRSAVTSILTSSDASKYSQYLSLVPLASSDEYYKCPETLNHMFAKDIEFEYKVITGYGCHEIMEQIMDYSVEVQSERDAMDYAIDGIVIDCCNEEVRDSLGRDNDINKYQIAYKFPPEVRYVKVKDVFMTTGRTGITVPNVLYETTYFNGGEHDHSSLSSYARFMRMNLKKDEIIKLTYNGDVMPYPSKYDCEENRNNKNKPFEFPKRCQCGFTLVHIGANYYCENPLCSDKKIAAFTHFYKTFGITDMAEKTVEKLLDNKVITSYTDAIYPDYNILWGMQGFEEKSISRFKNQMDKMVDTKISEAKLVKALGISGETDAKAILSKVPLDVILNKPEILYETKIPKIGTLKKDSFLKKLNLLKPTVIKLKKELIIKPVKVNDDAVKLCFTGFRDKRIKDMLEALGFEVVNNMSKKVSYVLIKKAGHTSPTVKAAKDYKIPVLTLMEFKDTILRDMEVDM